jgi:hypothetical protein
MRQNQNQVQPEDNQEVWWDGAWDVITACFIYPVDKRVVAK